MTTCLEQTSEIISGGFIDHSRLLRMPMLPTSDACHMTAAEISACSDRMRHSAYLRITERTRNGARTPYPQQRIHFYQSAPHQGDDT
jgi:hypothetical protein